MTNLYTFKGEAMKNLHSRDILLEYDGDDLSKYGLFPLFTWYLFR